MTAKDVAIHALRTTPIPQCVGQGIVFDGTSVIAMCAFNIIQQAFSETSGGPVSWGHESRFPGVLVYANDGVGLSFDEIADLMEQDVITVDMKFREAKAFVESHPRQLDTHTVMIRPARELAGV